VCLKAQAIIGRYVLTNHSARSAGGAVGHASNNTSTKNTYIASAVGKSSPQAPPEARGGLGGSPFRICTKALLGAAV